MVPDFTPHRTGSELVTLIRFEPLDPGQGYEIAFLGPTARIGWDPERGASRDTAAGRRRSSCGIVLDDRQLYPRPVLSPNNLNCATMCSPMFGISFVPGSRALSIKMPSTAHNDAAENPFNAIVRRALLPNIDLAILHVA